MGAQVLLTADAVRDLEDIYAYIDEHDSPKKADQFIERIEQRLSALSDSSAIGRYLRELSVLGIREYREVFLKPYRIIYRVTGNKVYVMLIADGRRDMQTMLERRLLQG